MKKTLLLNIFFLSIASIFCQPGYMGKKLILMYNSNFNMNFGGYTKSGNGTYYLPNAIYHGPQIEYVIGRKNSIGIKYSYCKTYANFYDKTDMTFPAYNYSQKYICKIEDSKIELVYKIYSKKENFIAPLGNYFQLSIAKHWYKTTDLYTDQILYADHVMNSVGFTFGKQRIFYNSLILDYGIRVGIAANFKKIQSINKDVVTTTHTIIGVQNLFGLNLGIGYLAPKFKN